MALIAMLSMASCSSDDVASDLGGDGVTVTLRLPSGLESKATFGDQNTVTLDELKYTVFEKNGETLIRAFSNERSAFGANKYTETETIKLGKGKEYTIVFYADKKGNGFVTFENGNISVNYEGLSSNNENYDAFYSMVEVPNGKTSVSTTLTRPFSQLNWGTDDLDVDAVSTQIEKGLTATVKVTNGLYTGMDLLTGEVTEGTAVTGAVTFTETAVVAPTQENTPNFPVTGYDLLAMNYLLTGDGTVDCELEFTNGFSPVTVNAAPVKTNYRTNIYGSLLTNPVNFNIEVNSAFEGSYDNGLISVSDERQLSAAIEKGIGVKLSRDISPESEIVIPSGYKNSIDLNGHTIDLGENSIRVADGAQLTLDDETGNGVIKMNCDDDLSSAIMVENGGKLIVNNGKIYNGIKTTSKSPATGIIVDENAEVIINGGEIGSREENSNTAAMVVLGKAVINGGSFVAGNSNNAIIWISGTKEATHLYINGGTFGYTGYTGFIVLAGCADINITGGLFMGAFPGGDVIGGSALFTVDYPVENEIEFNISGGTFYSGDTLINQFGSIDLTKVLKITGGYWQVGDFRKYIQTGYDAVENGDYEGKPVYEVRKS